ARIWKISFNENSKISAYYNEFPELNHHEINGFVQPKGNFCYNFLFDEDDHPKIK
ncbi:MAG: bifunctional phosphoglucose/phosphomannose isomerase, partial [Candidatus Aenigmarchaeota archaeon]|nr:bifunctional phosphoglucose/phosphomannose isomerase [Candidatus Aenigmarchaeota archaeon]